MQIDLKTNKKVRYIFYVAALLVWIAIMAYIYINFIDSSSDKSSNPSQTPIAQNKNNLSKNAENLKSDTDISKINPFVELSGVKAGNVVSGDVQGSLPTGGIASGNAGLPQIPSGFPRPTVGSIPLPSIAGEANTSLPIVQQHQQTPAPAAVQGVFTGKNGNNMAIMNDGKVVATGDTYQDGRIAYIGGDGIQFDDGHTVSYK